ncbi:hypothetical protein HPB50_011960 [Hyalomma asiaticum]|uniref:Uncharacterized protein n=1 Tax=Hyalomma asiaticum TaxID=266040 RepID=A0ACB7TDJ0_HYAAI|nr:hypothetical protein HPB50_011960 [Hyalomma asiaticum]
MSGEDKVGHLLKGVAEEVYNFLIAKDDLSTPTNFRRLCRTFEALKTRRVLPKFGRLENVPTVASMDVIACEDISSVVRRVVREELVRLQDADYGHQCAFDKYMPEQPLSWARERPIERRQPPEEAWFNASFPAILGCWGNAPLFVLQFLDGRSTACEIVSSVCQALWDVLGPVYVARPSSASEWLQIAREFEERWNMPHCVGAIDGKHVAIECPGKSGSEDYNYKNFFSKSMLAVCDACYRFLYVEVGHHGSDSDGGVFGQSKLHDIILSKNEGFPPDAPLGNIGQIPFYLVGDEAFPLKTYLMRPYPRKSKLDPFISFPYWTSLPNAIIMGS